MPRISSLCSTLLLVMSACPALAQEPASDTRRTSVTVTQTPEMWIYEQERIRYEDPKMAVRRKAELRGAQRAARLAATKWYGMSNSRPSVAVTPSIGGSYSPYWGSNSYDPMRWRPEVAPVVVMQPETVR
jgi:hypothetical protein